MCWGVGGGEEERMGRKLACMVQEWDCQASFLATLDILWIVTTAHQISASEERESEGLALCPRSFQDSRKAGSTFSCHDYDIKEKRLEWQGWGCHGQVTVVSWPPIEEQISLKHGWSFRCLSFPVPEPLRFPDIIVRAWTQGWSRGGWRWLLGGDRSLQLDG